MKKQMYLELQARFEEVQIWNQRLQKILRITPRTIEQWSQDIKNNKNSLRSKKLKY